MNYIIIRKRIRSGLIFWLYWIGYSNNNVIHYTQYMVTRFVQNILVKLY